MIRYKSPGGIATFHMKSGAALSFRCDKLRTTTETATNRLTGYEMIGGIIAEDNPQLMYLRIEDISAISWAPFPKRLMWVGWKK